MKLNGITLVGADTKAIRLMLDQSISSAELQNWLNDRLDYKSYDEPTRVDFEDVNALLDFIAENLTEEQDL